jgi:hypothetical protein
MVVIKMQTEKIPSWIFTILHSRPGFNRSLSLSSSCVIAFNDQWKVIDQQNQL